MSDVALAWMVLLVDSTAAMIFLLLIIFNKSTNVIPRWHKFGVTVTCGGLIGQSYRSSYFLWTGISPTDAELPLWCLKDFGIGILAAFYMYRWIKKRYSRQGSAGLLSADS